MVKNISVFNYRLFILLLPVLQCFLNLSPRTESIVYLILTPMLFQNINGKLKYLGLFNRTSPIFDYTMEVYY